MTRKITRHCEKCNDVVDEKESCDYLDCAFMFVDEEEMEQDKSDFEAFMSRLQELENQLNQLQKQMQEQQLRLQIMEQEKDRKHDPFSPWTTPKFPDTNPWNAKCPVCGIDYDALMWYSCMRSNCPNKVRCDYSGGTWY